MMLRQHRPYARRDRGAVLPMVAILLLVLMTSTAFAIDQGRQRSARRSLQADADVIALDAVSVIGGLDAILAKPLALAEANASASRNAYDIVIDDSMLEVGHWAQNVFTPMTAATDFPNAVHVMLTNSIDTMFDFSQNQSSVRREAYAIESFGDAPCGGLACPSTTVTTTTGPTTTGPTTTCVAPCGPTTTQPATTTTTTPGCSINNTCSRKGARSRAEIGSVLAAFEFYDQPSADPSFNVQVEAQATFMNTVLTQQLGINTPGGIALGAAVNGSAAPVTGPLTGLRADAVSYKGLANGYASLDDVAAQMGFGNLNQLMSTQVSAKDFLTATADVLSSSGDAADVNAGTILGEIARDVDASLKMTFGDYLKASTGQEGLLATEISAIDLLHGSAMIIDGKNFFSADLPVSIPLVGGAIPTRISIIEPPTTHTGFRREGDAGPSTAQFKLAMQIPLSGINVDLRGINPLFGAHVLGGTFPIVIEVAKAESVYGSMACPSETDSSFTGFGVQTGAVSISYGNVLDADLQTAADVTIQNSAVINGSVNLLGVALNFATATAVNSTYTWSEGVSYAGNQSSNAGVLGTYSEIVHIAPYPSQWVRYLGGVDTIASGSYDLTPFSGSVAAPLQTYESAIHDAINAALAPMLAELDNELIEPLLSTFGITLAGADARMQNLKCKTRTLVNVDD